MTVTRWSLLEVDLTPEQRAEEERRVVETRADRERAERAELLARIARAEAELATAEADKERAATERAEALRERRARKRDRARERRDVERLFEAINGALHAATLNVYFEHLTEGVEDLKAIVTAHFELGHPTSRGSDESGATYWMLYRDGDSTGKALTITRYCMPSGRWELVAYVS